MNNETAHAIAKTGPFLRGSDEWIQREHARSLTGAACVNMHEIPRGQAHDEPNAHRQQAEIPAALRLKVREELRGRRETREATRVTSSNSQSSAHGKRPTR